MKSLLNFEEFLLFDLTPYVLGYLLIIHRPIFAGTILPGHSSLERVFGFGLKQEDALQGTQLDGIGISK